MELIYCEQDVINSYFNGYKDGKAEAKPKLIPCSKKLPEVNQWVLCQCRAGIFDVLWLSEGREWNNAFATYMFSFVLAWMPLPELYEEGEQE